MTVPECEGCKATVDHVTTEVEDALCDLCLEIERYDRKIRSEGVFSLPVAHHTESRHPSKSHITSDATRN